MFYGSESRDSAGCPAVLLPLRTTPSVAEQEGQLIETEATEHLKNTIIQLNRAGSITHKSDG
ncbi:hypothetical protein [Escherichia coli]|uniref:hypothetical protein n=1 Tax=Escherichia coli TaxID=562 RepID=UPI0032C213F7